MYRHDFNAAKVDWMQLRLLVCWVRDPWEKGSYHTRDRKQLSESLTDQFLKALIDEGKFTLCYACAVCAAVEPK